MHRVMRQCRAIPGRPRSARSTWCGGSGELVARMSEAKSGTAGPGSRFAHPGYELRTQRLLQRQEIAPGEALLQRAAQQERRMEGRERAQLAGPGLERIPTPARFGNAFADIEQRLRRRPAETDEHLRARQLDLTADERQADCRL